MVDPDQAPPVPFRAFRLQDVQVGKRKTVMFVIVSQKSERWILVLDLGVKHGLVPPHHLLKATRSVDDMNELLRTDA
jgi:hypothetical protein